MPKFKVGDIVVRKSHTCKQINEAGQCVAECKVGDICEVLSVDSYYPFLISVRPLFSENVISKCVEHYFELRKEIHLNKAVKVPQSMIDLLEGAKQKLIQERVELASKILALGKEIEQYDEVINSLKG